MPKISNFYEGTKKKKQFSVSVDRQSHRQSQRLTITDLLAERSADQKCHDNY